MGNSKNARQKESNVSADQRKVRLGTREFWRSEGQHGMSEMGDAPTVDKGRYVKKGFLMFGDAAAKAAGLASMVVPGLGAAALASTAYQAFAPEGSEFHSKGPVWKKALGLGAGVLGGIVAGKAIKAIANSGVARDLGTKALQTVGRGQSAIGEAMGKAAPALKNIVDAPQRYIAARNAGIAHAADIAKKSKDFAAQMAASDKALDVLNKTRWDAENPFRGMSAAYGNASFMKPSTEAAQTAANLNRLGFY